ncbi:MAG: substrate-binding domain-containing protein [Euryarchaeota archaeon]|nr:substrate-binding domain-containing protein [Euryarchaeota archaeon]
MKLALLVLVVLTLSLGCLTARPSAIQELRLATTTTTCDTGIIHALAESFEKRYEVRVLISCTGTGQAIKIGELGAADVVVAHAPKLEEESVAKGFFVDRRPLMYNDFVIIGPEADPAGIKGLQRAQEAFRRIAQAQAAFLSRGDKSGTETKEKEVWATANITPSGTWYRAVGKGMGDTIVMADAQGAYTLSDRGTYLAMRGKIGLTVLAEKDPVLANYYHVMAVNPEKYQSVNHGLAEAYIDYLTSREGQGIIADFGRDKYGESLFLPSTRIG